MKSYSPPKQKQKSMWNSVKPFWAGVIEAVVCGLLLTPWVGRAQQQQTGVCAGAKIEILQELTLERIGFEATLEVTDNDGEDPITDFSAELTFVSPATGTNTQPIDASDLFFVRAPELDNISDVNGTGVIGPTKKAVVRWFIIPKLSAGGTSPDGVRYQVGVRLAGKLKGVQIPPEVLEAVPDYISVKPEPQLEITYFQPRDVQGDDPFTETVESPIPFTLGVLVKNSGYGVARDVKINSQQPKIVENKQNLLLVARLLGTRVMDSPLQRADLLVNLGSINPGETRKGAWDMITSLSGEFVEFKASYTHASELGGEETSIIKSLDAHFISHEVLNDQAGRDKVKDFLADTDRDPDLIPDALYESEGNVLPVNNLSNASIAGGGVSFLVNLTADRVGWGYVRLNDPGQARLRIASIERSDGKILNTNNYWTNVRYTKIGNNRQAFLNILDLVDLGSYQYTVTYAPALVDADPPVTSLQFAGESSFADGKFYIVPGTQMFFISEDESPVSIYYSITNGPFLPALPFTLPNPGEYGISYYATDLSGNRETNQSATLVVSGEAPGLASLDSSEESIFVPGEALSIRPAAAQFTFQAAPSPTRVNAQLDVFRGVVGWPILTNVPSSPASATSASLGVAGEHADFYRYRLDASPWSAERPVSQPLALSGLASGSHTLSVLGRSQYGDFLADSNALQVSWVVDPAAPAVRIGGAPATPTHESEANLLVSGSGVTDYRWTIDHGYYRAETAVANPIVLTNLNASQHVVSVIGKVNGVYQGTNEATTVSWRIDPGYGADLSALALVRRVAFTNIGTAPVNFVWDGRNDAGTALPPGWYTIRLALSDTLNRTNYTTRLVQIGELAGGTSVLADVNRGAQRPYARGRWAVWQDQSSGNWQVFGMDLTTSNAPPFAISNQGGQNPRTDGRFVVWQERRVDGNWDVWYHDPLTRALPIALTDTPDLNEVNASMDWPWVVYQYQPVGNTNAPWLLRARNLATGESLEVSPSTQDELDPAVQAGRVVWQDFRDVGFGEIYLKDLETGEERRLTTNSFGQYHPALFDRWVAWQDNRNGEVDIYGFDLTRDVEVRLTDSAENEARPFVDGPWLVCEEDSLGVGSSNLRLIHLPSLRVVPLTRSGSLKTRPSLAAERAVWQETEGNLTRVVAGALPVLQAVFQNQNAVAVTEAMAAYQSSAHALLAAWHAQAGVQEITRYASLVPQVSSETVVWTNGAPSGPDFPLVPGTFLWVRFGGREVLDLGVNNPGPINLTAGVNVFSQTAFPSAFSAYRLLQQLGLDNIRAVRMLDAESGRWRVAEVRGNRVLGQDFAIPHVAVLMLDMVKPVNNWQPN